MQIASPRTIQNLTVQERRRLTVWKWRYSLESAGFTPEQIERLVFFKWLRAHRASVEG